MFLSFVCIQLRKLGLINSHSATDANNQSEKYMLLAGWEVRIGKNCDRGLENAARGCRPRASFSSPGSQFFPIRTNPKAYKFFYKWVCLTILPLNRLTRRLQYKPLAKNLTRKLANKSNTIRRKMY